MRIIIIFLLFSFGLYGQGIEPSSLQPSPWQNSILKSVIPYEDPFTGQTLYIYQHDSLAIASADSIYLQNDTIFLRDGSGYVVMPEGNAGTVTSVGLTSGTTGTDINVSGSPVTTSGNLNINIPTASAANRGALSSADWTTFNGKVGGTGVATRVAWWGGVDSLSSSANLFWDDVNGELEIKSIPIGSNAANQLYAGVGAGLNATGASASNFFGLNAGNGATGASYSNFFGISAGNGATSASRSNFFGESAGNGATSAFRSNFFGLNAGFNATNASYSNFFGQRAGFNATNASYSNFFGDYAGNGATGAFSSNFFGLNAGFNATNASYSNFFGQNAGNGATGASYSNFFGISAGNGATSASRSNFFGESAGNGATFALRSNFFGLNAGFNATNASYSNFFGQRAGFNATNASYSNFFGDYAGNGATNASYSNFFGDNIGSPLIGFNNILIGRSVTLPDATNNGMNLGSVLFGTGFWNSGAKNSTGSAGGRIGILTNAPQNTLHVQGDARITNTTGTATMGLGRDANGKIVDLGFLPTATSTPQTFIDWSSTVVASWFSNNNFNSGKRVGLGTLNPTHQLDANGDVRLRGAIYNSANSAGSAGQVLTSQGAGAWTWTTPAAGMSNFNLGINNGSYSSVTHNQNVTLNAGTNITLGKSGNTITINSSATTPQTFFDWGSVISTWNSTNNFNSGKWVGFGVSSPTRQIDANGDVRLRGAIYNSANSAGSAGQVLTSQGTGAWAWTTPAAPAAPAAIVGQISSNISQDITIGAATSLTGTFSSSGGVTGNNTFITVPVAGIYLITFSVSANNSNTERDLGLIININDASIGAEGSMFVSTPAVNLGTSVSKTIIRALTANDNVRTKMFIDSNYGGGTLNKAALYYTLTVTKI